jgi:hypothetical protein
MAIKVRIDDVLTAELIGANEEHIRDFLEQEGIGAHPDDLGATEVSERQVKELLAELAHDLES